MLEVKELYFSYTGKEPYILNNVNLNIPKGGFLSIIGENGSAKTTLLKLILGLLKPIKGVINTSNYSVGYVPQRMDSFNSSFPITVKELLKVHAKTLGIKDNKAIDEVLRYVNMTAFKNSLIGSLSGGQQQRIFIGRALLGNPKLLALDELSSGLDAKTQQELYELLRTLNKEKGITILSVEHNISKALAYSTHIINVKDCCANLYTINDFKNTIYTQQVLI